jgi:tetratricopeptide (TPR) repeat protein
MKVIPLLILIAVIGFIVYNFSYKKFHNKKQKKFNRKPFIITSVVTIVLLGFVVAGLYTSATAPDTQCTQIHNTNPVPPLVATENGYFKLGDFYYDQGNCTKAIAEYTKALQLNPAFYQAYNNRAYTNMRMQNYKDALPDLNKAIQLNPNYVNALMNRGDIHNYYYQINRNAAIADYKKVITLGAANSTSVCGHLLLAEHNGWNVGTFIGIFGELFGACK